MRKANLWILLLAALLAVLPLQLATGNRGLAEGEPPTPNRYFLPLVSQLHPLPTVFGIEMHGIPGGTTLQKVSQAGTYWVRRNGVLWSRVEPEKGQRNWSELASLERDMLLAYQNHMQVILIVRSTPAWAQKSPGSLCGPVKASEIDAFGDFLYDLVARYSVAPYYVRHFEIWNEPDAPVHGGDELYGCWGEPGDPYYGGRYYGEVLKRISPRIKAANSAANVLVGGLLLDCDPYNPPDDPPGSGRRKDCSPSRFLEGILVSDASSAFDGISFHAYDYYTGAQGGYYNPNWHTTWNSNGPVAAAKVNYLHGLLAAYGVSGKYLINTETALLCSVDCDAAFEATKANHLAQAYAQAIRLHLVGNIWYDLYGSWRNSGLINSDGSPRPAFNTYGVSRQMLANAAFIQEPYLPGATAYEFAAGKRRVWVVWSQDGTPRFVNLPGTPLAAYDLFGSPLAVSSSMLLDNNLIYLDWGP